MNRLLNQIEKEARSIRDKILKRQKPSMRFPLRNLSNVKFDAKTGFFEMGRKTKERTLAVSTVKTFAQSLKMIALSKNLIETDDIATKREAYYVAKGWGEEVGFGDQTESDTVLDDVEALFLVNREQLGFVPEEKGGEVAGNLMVVDHDRDSGEEIPIDCTRFGSGAYSIPISVEDLRFESDASFVLAIETAGMFQRLVKHNYWREANCILISMGGGQRGQRGGSSAAWRTDWTSRSMPLWTATPMEFAIFIALSKLVRGMRRISTNFSVCPRRASWE